MVWQVDTRGGCGAAAYHFSRSTADRQTDELHNMCFLGYSIEINILPMQMAEQLAVEVNVKNMMEQQQEQQQYTGQPSLLGLDNM